MWLGLRREDVFPLHAHTVISGLANHRDSLVSSEPLARLIERHLEIGVLEHARVPVHLVAFDTASGEEVVLSTGPALGAVLATAAIPGILPPVRRGQQVLIDGGVVNNTPVSHAVERGAERIIVLPTLDRAHHGTPTVPRGALDAVINAFTVLTNARLQADITRFSTTVELIELPATNPRHVRPTDFAHARELIDLAEGSALAHLAERDQWTLPGSNR